MTKNTLFALIIFLAIGISIFCSISRENKSLIKFSKTGLVVCQNKEYGGVIFSPGDVEEFDCQKTRLKITFKDGNTITWENN